MGESKASWLLQFYLTQTGWIQKRISILSLKWPQGILLTWLWSLAEVPVSLNVKDNFITTHCYSFQHLVVFNTTQTSPHRFTQLSLRDFCPLRAVTVGLLCHTHIACSQWLSEIAREDSLQSLPCGQYSQVQLPLFWLILFPVNHICNSFCLLLLFSSQEVLRPFLFITWKLSCMGACLRTPFSLFQCLMMIFLFSNYNLFPVQAIISSLSVLFSSLLICSFLL